LGAITIGGDSVTRNPAYYVIAHASKLVDPGSYRIGSSMPEGLPNVAFIRADGKQVLIVQNDSNTTKQFEVRSGNQHFNASLPAGATGTWLW
jgi:glucosylceramidase